MYLRLAQFDRWRDPEFRLAFSRNVITAKLTAQQRLLARHQRNHPGILEEDAPARIRELIEKVATADSVEVAQGMEGGLGSLCLGGKAGSLPEAEKSFVKSYERIYHGATS